jgi:hypothetical protein
MYGNQKWHQYFCDDMEVNDDDEMRVRRAFTLSGTSFP